jgi:hypothetical protein
MEARKLLLKEARRIVTEMTHIPDFDRYKRSDCPAPSTTRVQPYPDYLSPLKPHRKDWWPNVSSRGQRRAVVDADAAS